MSNRKQNAGLPILVTGMLIIIMVIIAVVGILGSILGWFSDYVGDVVEEEFSASELLQKYEWFKDTAATLDAKRANIQIYATRMDSIIESYGDTPRSDWDRTDKEQFNLWIQEQAGVVASYNQLAAEYNAQMSKFNWRFTNIGDLPKGATEVVPREFQSYQESIDS